MTTVIENPMPTSSPTVETRYFDGYTANRTAPRRARADIALYPGVWGLDQLVDSAQVIVPELVTNVVVPGALCAGPETSAGRIGGSATRTDRGVRLVTDTSHVLPRPRSRDRTSTGGRGLRLVGDLADRWGCTLLSAGRRMWAELDAPAVP